MQGKGLIGEREEDKRKRESKEFFFKKKKILLLLTEGMGMDRMLNVFLLLYWQISLDFVLF